MSNLFTKVPPLSPNSSCRLHPHRHTRPATPCRNPFSRAPIPLPTHPTLPRTFQSGQQTLCFLWFWCHPFSLLRIYAPWSLSRLSIVPFHPIQVDLVLLPFPLPPKPEQRSTVHLRTSPMRFIYIALKLKRTLLCMRSLPTYLRTVPLSLSAKPL